jgi:hypothetical protein
MIEENPGHDSKKGSEQSSGSVANPPAETPIDKTSGKPSGKSGEEKPKQPRKLLVEIAKGDELAPFEKETLRVAKQTYRLTLWAIVIAAVGAAFVLEQLQQMTWNNQILAGQSESAVAGAVESERNTRAQINAMQDQVDAIKRQMRQDQRPYIEVILGGPGPDKEFGINMPNNVLHLPLKMTVLGKTPAKHVHGRLFLEVVKVNQDPLLEKNTAPALDTFSGIVFPNVPQEVHAIRMKAKRGNKLGEFDLAKDSEASDLLAYRSYLAAYGTYTYDDAFNIQHWTKFCVTFHAKSPVEYPIPGCVRYNDVDNNQ